MDKKTLRNDLILIGSLLLVAVLCLVLILTNRQKDNLIATISVQNDIVETIDLSKKEAADYYIDGLKGQLHVHTHDGAIDGKPNQLAFLHDADHPFAGDAAEEEGRQEAHNGSHRREASHGFAESHLKHILDI